MKNDRNNGGQRSKSVSNSHNSRPENKDNIDSRHNEEWDTKGDDVTHNKKEHQSDRRNVKNDD